MPLRVSLHALTCLHFNRSMDPSWQVLGVSLTARLPAETCAVQM